MYSKNMMWLSWGQSQWKYLSMWWPFLWLLKLQISCSDSMWPATSLDSPPRSAGSVQLLPHTKSSIGSHFCTSAYVYLFLFDYFFLVLFSNTKSSKSHSNPTFCLNTSLSFFWTSMVSAVEKISTLDLKKRVHLKYGLYTMMILSN